MSSFSDSFLQPSGRSRQPAREPWQPDRFARERAITLGMTLESSTRDVYNSATRSYLNFCKLHNLSIDPTPDNLSNYILWICIADPAVAPATASGYLSGICNNLEPHYPNIRIARNSPLVSKTLVGLRKRFTVPVTQKRALSVDDVS
ncbi:hypothetical protein BDV93DRAFT_456453 [Ceratobasidium sp. AG-I]|nr:hypothetical protein BDV93DRAFT_456453 [Ceratobasidium sp. AG-I]